MHLARNLVVLIGIALLATAWPKTSEANYFTEKTESQGPLEGRNVIPLWNLFYVMPIQTTKTLGQNHFKFFTSFDLVSIDEKNNNPRFQMAHDMEVYRTAFNFTYGLLDNIDVHVELPFLGFGNGILDGFTGWYHENLLFGAGSRSGADDQFSYRASANGQNIYAFTPRQFEISDVNVDVKWQVVKETDVLPSVSVRAGLKLPTGDYAEATGSGEFDYGFGVSAMKSFNRFHVFGGFDFSIIEDPQALRSFIDGEIYHWYLGGEFALVKDYLSYVTQIEFQTTPTVDTGLGQFDRPIFEINPGFKGSFLNRRIQWRASLREDIIPNSTADYTASFSLGFQI